MASSLLLLAAIGAAVAGFAFLIARQVSRHQRALADEAVSGFATFRATLAPQGVSDRVARVVYDFFAVRERATGASSPPRSTDELWGDHLISEPEELADVRGALLVALGCGTDVQPPVAGDLRTVADLAVWLEHETGERPRPPSSASLTDASAPPLRARHGAAKRER
jgi:hypothetical protein